MKTQSIIQDLSGAFAEAWQLERIPEEEIRAIRAAADDPHRFRAMLRRRLCGDPIAYVVGGISFRGRQFKMDRRAHITDPETTHLVEAVLAEIRARPTGAAPALVAEVGVGAGVLGISVMLESAASGGGVHLAGLDLDASALALCRENQALHGVSFPVVESDMLDGWGDRPQPDIVFGDLPWGDETTLYDEFRDLHHYLHMPPAAAFPLGDRSSAQRELIGQVVARGWRARILLNCGTLPDADIAGLVAAAPGRRAVLHRPAPTAAILDLAAV